RRQHLTPDGRQVRIEFTYTAPGHQERTTHVHLALFTTGEVEAALAATGWTSSHTHTHAGFCEVLANAGDSRCHRARCWAPPPTGTPTTATPSISGRAPNTSSTCCPRSLPYAPGPIWEPVRRACCGPRPWTPTV